MAGASATAIPHPVRISAADAVLNGDITLPAASTGLVVFAHGSGSSRRSARNRAVADVLQQGGLATLLLDLLTEREALIDSMTAEFRFDIPLLANRVVSAVDWARTDSHAASLPLGLFGASTGAAAAVIAAAKRPAEVRAVVSRGGRPDLAEASLGEVTAPTLLIVGGADEVVIDLNRQALALLEGPKHLHIVPGATHLFEEPGALDEVARLARDWFTRYLVSPA